MKNLLRCAMLIIAVVIGASCLASCSKDDEPTQNITLEDALNDGTIETQRPLLSPMKVERFQAPLRVTMLNNSIVS